MKNLYFSQIVKHLFLFGISHKSTCLSLLPYGFIRLMFPVRHPLWELEVEGSISSAGDSGVRSDMADW